MVGRQVLVIVPGLAGPAPDLDEPHAALEQPAGDQELPGLGARPVHRPDRLGLAADVERLGRLGLHPVGQLERLDPRLERGVVRALGRVQLVEPPHQVELAPLAFGRLGLVADVLDQAGDLRVLGVDVGALVGAGRKADRQFWIPTIGRPPGHMAMKPGRFWFSEPRP